MKLRYRINIKEFWNYCGFKLRRNQYKTHYWNRMPIFLRITSGYYIVGYIVFFVIANIYNHLAGYPAAKIENWIYNFIFAIFWPVVSYVVIRFAPRCMYFFLAVCEKDPEQELVLENGYLKTLKDTFLLNRVVQIEEKAGMLYLVYPMQCAQEEIIPIPQKAFENEKQKAEFLRFLKEEQKTAEQLTRYTLDNSIISVSADIRDEMAAEIMELSLSYQNLRKIENRLGDIIQILIWVLLGISVPYFAILTGSFIWFVTWTSVVLFARELTSTKRAKKRYLRDIRRGGIPELLGEWKMWCNQEGILLKHQEIYDFYDWKNISILIDTDEYYVLCDKHGNGFCVLPKTIWKDKNIYTNFRAICMNYGVKTKNAHTPARNHGKGNAIASLVVYIIFALFMSAIVFGPTLAMLPSLVEKSERIEEQEPVDAGPKEELVEEAKVSLDEQVKTLKKVGVQVPKTVKDNQEVFIQMSSSAAEEILNKPYVEILCSMGRVEDYGDGQQFSDQLHWLDTQNDYYSGKNYSYVLAALEAMSDGKLEFEVLEEVPYESIRFSFEGLEYEFDAERKEVFDHQYLAMLNEILEASGYEKTIYVCREPENYFFQKGDLMFLREMGWNKEFEAVVGFATEQP